MRQALHWAAASAVCFTLAACDGRTGAPRQEADRTAPTEGVAEGEAAHDANDAANTAAPADEAPAGRSILRPDVVPPLPVLTIEPLHVVIPFGASGLALDEAGRAAVDAALDKPVMRMGGPIVLRGHTDSRGTDGDNRVASRLRAESVRDYLVGKGVPAGRIQVIALGETRPIAPNAHADGSDDPQGRAQNRRVEIDVEPPASAAPGSPDRRLE